MRIRAILLLRNDRMISARSKLGWSQRDLAEVSAIPITAIQNLEAFRFSGRNVPRYAEKLALTLDIPIEEILPKGAVGVNLTSSHIRISEVSTERFLEVAGEQVTLPGPPDEYAITERNEKINNSLTLLPEKCRRVLEMRYGLPDGREYSYGQIAEVLGLCRERIRQIEKMALLRMRHPRLIKGLVEYAE